MTRTRTFRLVSIAVVFAFVLTLTGVPGTAGAVPSRDSKGLRRTASARRLKGLGSTGLRTGLSALALDDNIPGVLKTLPFTVSDTLNTSSDTDDVFRVHLNRGDHLVATLTIDPSALADVDVYGPGSTDIWSDDAIGWSDMDTGVLDLRVPADGDYYLDVATFAGTWSGAYTLDARLLPTAADDDIPGVLRTLPFNVSDTLDVLDAVYAVDPDDVSRVYLNKGDHLVATMTADPDYVVSVDLYGPAATSIWAAGDPVASANGAGVLSYYAPVAGYYYLDVWALWPLPADPPDPAYPGFAGPYTLDAQAIPPSPTTITIKTNATSVRIGNIPILSGAVTPFGMVGKNIVAYVMKPGKTYWTYSSNRTVYNLGGKAAWQYKYYFKPGMVKGYYKFKAVAPAPGFASSLGWLTSTSPTTVSIRLR
jgi:hypothetical protein